MLNSEATNNLTDIQIMPRDINTATDPYSTTLVKLIPSELVAAYSAVLGLLKVSDSTMPAKHFQAIMIQGADIIEGVLWAVFWVVTLLTPLYLRKIQGVTSVTQLSFTTCSFVIWAYSLGGIFELKQWYQPLLGGIVLILWTLIIPLIPIPKPPPASSPPVGGGN
jgi:hypothetical protein